MTKLLHYEIEDCHECPFVKIGYIEHHDPNGELVATTVEYQCYYPVYKPNVKDETSAMPLEMFPIIPDECQLPDIPDSRTTKQLLNAGRTTKQLLNAARGIRDVLQDIRTGR